MPAPVAAVTAPLNSKAQAAGTLDAALGSAFECPLFTLLEEATTSSVTEDVGLVFTSLRELEGPSQSLAPSATLGRVRASLPHKAPQSRAPDGHAMI